MITRDDLLLGFDGFNTCDCGRTHTLSTRDIAFGAGAVGRFYEMIGGALPEGSRLLYIYDGKVEAGQAVHAVLNRKYRLNVCCEADLKPDRAVVQTLELEEDTRGIVAVGGGSTADIAKYAAAKCRLPLFLLGTSQATAGYLASSSMLLSDGFYEVFKTKPPEYFAFDTDFLSDKAELNAAGFGEVCSRLTALFDWEFAGEVNGEDYCKGAEKHTVSLIADLIKGVGSSPASLHPSLIAKAALRLSAVLQLIGDSRLMCGGDMQIMHGLELLHRQKDKPVKLWGENEMLTAQVALKIYGALIEGGELGFIPPPDNNLRLDTLSERFGLPAARAFSKVRPYIPLDELLRQGCCLDECRQTLSFKLKIYQKILFSANRVFKRLYKDKGYSYNEYIAADDLALCVGLAPDLREKFTTLTYMKQLGVLDRYIA